MKNFCDYFCRFSCLNIRQKMCLVSRSLWVDETIKSGRKYAHLESLPLRRMSASSSYFLEKQGALLKEGKTVLVYYLLKCWVGMKWPNEEPDRLARGGGIHESDKIQTSPLMWWRLIKRLVEENFPRCKDFSLTSPAPLTCVNCPFTTSSWEPSTAAWNSARGALTTLLPIKSEKQISQVLLRRGEKRQL